MNNRLVAEFGNYLAEFYYEKWMTSNSGLTLAKFCALERAHWNNDGDGRGVALGCVVQLNSENTIEYSELQL